MSSVTETMVDLAPKLKTIMDPLCQWAQTMEAKMDPKATTLAGFRRSLQLDNFSCGAQSAFMILKYFEKARSVKNVTRELGTGESGTTEQAIKSLFRKRQLRMHAFAHGTLKRLRDAIDGGCPVLVGVDGDHYAVVFGYSPGKIYLADPAVTRAVLCGGREEAFIERWDRLGLIVCK